VTYLVSSEFQSIYGRIERTLRYGIEPQPSQFQSIYGRIEREDYTLCHVSFYKFQSIYGRIESYLLIDHLRVYAFVSIDLW